MSVYRIVFENPSGDKASITLDGTFRYAKKLNSISNGIFNLYVPKSKRTLFELNTIVYVYKDNTLDWKGVIIELRKYGGGQIGGIIRGYEYKLGSENGSYANSPYTTTASATIAGDIIGESTAFSDGTIDTGVNLDFRVTDGYSLWNALSSLIQKTGQDLEITYSDAGSDTIGVIDHLGSSTSAITLSDGIHIDNVEISQGLPQGNKVIVYGKSDGENQIKETATDATSISNYGTIVYPFIDRSIMSSNEAQEVADSLIKTTKLLTKEYWFDVLNPNIDVSVGDVITLNASDLDIDTEEVRITHLERRLNNNKERLHIGVSNKEITRAKKTQQERMTEIELRYKSDSTFMQGSGNTLSWGRGINAKSGASLKLPFYVSSIVTDEAGSMRVNSMTLDYDIDPFRSSVGTATEDSIAVGLSPGGFDSHDHNASDSGHDHALPTMTSGVSLNIEGDGAEEYDDATEFDLNDTDWTTINTYTNGNIDLYQCLHVHFDVALTSGSSEFCYVRVEIGSSDYYPSSSGARLRVDDQTGSASIDFDVPVQAFSGSSASFDIDVKNGSSLTTTQWNESHWWVRGHQHSISGYNANSDIAAVSDDSISGGLSGNSSTHDHNISIGDDASESGSVNASEVDIYLDYWNGTSWVNKHSVLNTGKTLDKDVDITDNDTYPDTTGWWRVRVEPDSANPDYAQAIVTIKHHLDN